MSQSDQFPDERYSLLLPAEVADVLRCSGSQVYKLFDKGVLRGPKETPRRIFAWSVKAYLDDTNAPAPAVACAEPAAGVVPEAKPTRRAAVRGKSRPGSRSRVSLPYPPRSR